MQKINFTKMVASGNDFVVIETLQHQPRGRLRKLAQNICDRKYGVGSDGLLVLERSKIADFKMRIFNPDGSEAQMCGNGARCAALYGSKNKKKINIATVAGIIKSGVNRDKVKIKLTDPRNIKLDIPLIVNNRRIRVNFIDTGVPHTVIFVEHAEGIDVRSIGEKVRYHKKFKPRGSNVDFVEIIDKANIKVRTYERGVEDETLACGTGVTASAIIVWAKLSGGPQGMHKINVYTRSGEVLRVYFDNLAGKIKNVWLQGRARVVYRGEYLIPRLDNLKISKTFLD